jgi:hypothetical protein
MNCPAVSPFFSTHRSSHALMAFRDFSLYTLPPMVYETSPDIRFMASSLSTSRMNLFSQFDRSSAEKARSNPEFHPSFMFLHSSALPEWIFLVIAE